MQDDVGYFVLYESVTLKKNRSMQDAGGNFMLYESVSDLQKEIVAFSYAFERMYVAW